MHSCAGQEGVCSTKCFRRKVFTTPTLDSHAKSSRETMKQSTGQNFWADLVILMMKCPTSIRAPNASFQLNHFCGYLCQDKLATTQRRADIFIEDKNINYSPVIIAYLERTKYWWGMGGTVLTFLVRCGVVGEVVWVDQIVPALLLQFVVRVPEQQLPSETNRILLKFTLQIHSDVQPIWAFVCSVWSSNGINLCR